MTDSGLPSAGDGSPPPRPAPSRRLTFPWNGPSTPAEILDEPLSPVLSLSVPEQELEILLKVREMVGEELRFERETAAEMEQLCRQAAGAEGEWDLAPLSSRYRDLLAGYFLRRGSVPAYESFGVAFRECLLLRVIDLASAEAPAGAPCAWFALGKTGRGEGDPGEREELFLLADGGPPESIEPHRRAVARLLADLGIIAAPDEGIRTASLGEWRHGALGEILEGRKKGVLPETLADLRPLAGDRHLAESFLTLLWGGMEIHRENLRRSARTTATLPLAVGFLGFLRVERSGRFRGGIDLDRFAVQPLTANVRMKAIWSGVRATGTIARIRGLLECGALDVALAADLVEAYQAFRSIGIRRRIETGWKGDAGRFIFPEEMAAEDDRALRAGLEAVGNLEKRIFSTAVHP